MSLTLSAISITYAEYLDIALIFVLCQGQKPSLGRSKLSVPPLVCERYMAEACLTSPSPTCRYMKVLPLYFLTYAADPPPNGSLRSLTPGPPHLNLITTTNEHYLPSCDVHESQYPLSGDTLPPFSGLGFPRNSTFCSAAFCVWILWRVKMFNVKYLFAACVTSVRIPSLPPGPDLGTFW